jgi:hypothetical protein
MFEIFSIWFQINGASGTWVCEATGDADMPGAVWFNGGYYRSFDVASGVQTFGPDILDGNQYSFNTIWSSERRSFRLSAMTYNYGTPLAYIVGQYL